MHFGLKFGALVKKKRGACGLTQQALAVMAFDDENYKTRISELENGKTRKPHQKTIDALVNALNISDAEMNRLLSNSPHPSYVDNLTDYFDASRTGKLHAEILIHGTGEVIFLYDCPMTAKIKRLEFFVEESILVWVTSAERRRPFGMPLDRSVAQYLVGRDKVEFYRFTRGLDDAQREGSYPLKIIQ